MATMPSTRENQKLLTRNKVLDASVAVFTGKGFAEATMEDIARASGVTRVTVYAHFPSKNDILIALTERLYDMTDGLYAEFAAEPVWSRATVRRWVEASAEHIRGLAPTIRVLTATLPTVARGRYQKAHEGYVAQLTSRPWRDTPGPEARQRALMAVLQLESFLSLWITREWPVETDDPLDLLTDSICHLLEPALQ